MTDHQEEKAALHAVRALSPDEERLFESESKYVPRMREALAEFEDTAAEIARLLPEEAPPEELRAQILTEVKARARGNVTPLRVPLRLLRNPVVAWAAAAAIALGAVTLWTRNHRLEDRATGLAQQQADAQGQVRIARDAQQAAEAKLADATAKITELGDELKRMTETSFAKNMEVAMLRSSLKRFEESSAMVVWNQEKQEGLLKLENMPTAQANMDYQLWIVCKQCQHPVNAGVVKVGSDGTTAIVFKPAHHIAEAMKFVVSIEAQGGVAEKSPDGPIVLASR